ncbi:olfactory receptor 5B12-like [Trichosurus vulpecula]|uniref:olfactory receptor 5B12-like n=1 Tax=Trichosurus vulpecula TaxID=9337 RepID=UPI00186ABC6F|nr:olfactory receptor 5B12-like [Trichosurus vulpecula]
MVGTVKVKETDPGELPKSFKSFLENGSEVKEFILVGLTDVSEFQVPLFIVFTIIYLITLAGNLGMIALISWDPRLHTPMYFFLSNLSIVDFGYSSAVTPKVMAGLLPGDKIISYNGCATQLFFLIGLIFVENFLLSAMAYDRCVAICKPLHYPTLMTSRICARLTIGSYICGFLCSCIHTGNTFSLHFCKSNVIHHFVCDIPPVMAASCSDIHINEMVAFFVISFTAFFALFIILISYLFIFITILRMHSTEGRQKAFSTCASHLTAVSIFYGSGIFMYLQPSSSHSMDRDKIASVFYTMVIPMLNPLVYSLRNKEVISAFKRALDGTKSSFRSSLLRKIPQ